MGTSIRRDILPYLTDIYLLLDDEGHILEFYQENNANFELRKDDVGKSLSELEFPSPIKEKIIELFMRIVRNKKDYSYLITDKNKNGEITKFDVKIVLQEQNKINIFLKKVEPDEDELDQIKTYLKCYDILNKLPTAYLDINEDGKIYFANLEFYRKYLPFLLKKKNNFFDLFNFSNNEVQLLLYEVEKNKKCTLEKLISLQEHPKLINFSIYEGLKEKHFIVEIKEHFSESSIQNSNVNKLSNYEQAVSHFSSAVMLRKPDGKIVYVNKRAEQIVGLSNTTLNGKNIYDFIHVDDIPKMKERVEQVLQGKTVPYTEIRLIRQTDKKEIVVESIIEKLQIAGETLIQVVFREITDLKKLIESSIKARIYEEHFEKLQKEIAQRLYIENQLQELLHEKIILIQEIHHRVKNNIQVINSIIRLELSRAKSTETHVLLNRILSRINSIYLVLEIAYQNELFSKLDLSKLITCLCDHIARERQLRVEFHTNLDSIFMPLDTGIPFAMIVNEIIYRYFEYSKIDLSHQNIHIELKNNILQNTLKIIFPLTEAFKNEQSDQIWYSLLTGLADQINGSFRFSYYEFTVLFELLF